MVWELRRARKEGLTRLDLVEGGPVHLLVHALEQLVPEAEDTLGRDVDERIFAQNAGDAVQVVGLDPLFHSTLNRVRGDPGPDLKVPRSRRGVIYFGIPEAEEKAVVQGRKRVAWICIATSSLTQVRSTKTRMGRSPMSSWWQSRSWTPERMTVVSRLHGMSQF